MNRKWIGTAFVLIAALVLVVGCAGKPEPAPAPVVEQAPPPPPPAPVEPPPAPPTQMDEKPWWDGELEAVTARSRREGLIGDVYFDFDKYELKADARERLQKNADFMNEHRDFIFRLEGHCDERGTNEYNLALGERRANAAKSYLESLGVAASRMQTVSYGEEQPECAEHTEGCWWQNRRAGFYIHKRMGG